MTAIAIALFVLASSDVADEYHGRPPRFQCVELHLDDPLYRSTPRITLNFTHQNGTGNPVQWHLWPFRHIEQEELVFGAPRYTVPPQ